MRLILVKTLLSLTLLQIEKGEGRSLMRCCRCRCCCCCWRERTLLLLGVMVVMICCRSELLEVFRLFRSSSRRRHRLLVFPVPPVLLLLQMLELLLLLPVHLLCVMTVVYRRVRAVKLMRRARMRWLGASCRHLPLPLLLILVKMVELRDLHLCHCRAP